VSTYVLSHDHSGVDGSEGLAHNTDLLRGDVVDVHEDALGVVVAAVLYSSPYLVFGFLSVLLDGHIY
jgi:hypothetical protein